MCLALAQHSVNGTNNNHNSDENNNNNNNNNSPKEKRFGIIQLRKGCYERAATVATGGGGEALV